MVTQYPDKIEIIWGGVPTQVNGKWTKQEGNSFSSECRAEPNAGGRVIKSESGQDLRFDFRVFMPQTSRKIPFGARATITLHDGLTYQSTVKRASNGQLNSRVWV